MTSLTVRAGGAARALVHRVVGQLAVVALLAAPTLALAPVLHETGAVAATAAPGPTPTPTASVRNIGTLGTSSSATAVDGSTIVGDSNRNATTVHAFAFDLDTSTMRDLGTLGGSTSHAIAVDDQIVVGEALTSTGVMHAFAYDLRTTTMRDLGTLGGSTSIATAVEGPFVVGNSSTGEGGQHAFAYDLRSGFMRDLGTLGGLHSSAVAVAGGLVTGTAGTSTGDSHAYAVDLTTASSGLRDLGTLGGRHSIATDIDDAVVVGRSATASGLDRAFSYDLVTGVMRDLETLGGGYSAAVAIHNGVAVGESVTEARELRGFAANADGSLVRDLGSLGGDSSQATAVGGRWVVGVARRAGDFQTRPFVYDLAATRPRMTDLGTLGGTYGVVVAIDGDVAVGRSRTAGGSLRATVWRIRATTAPTIRFGRFRYQVREDGGRATISVVRTGRTAAPVSVRYRTSSFDAIARRDFNAVSGTLRFAAGQIRRTFTVPIINDTRPEAGETLMLLLSSPSRGAVLGTPQAAPLMIRSSDQRPDLMISTSSSSSYSGDNVYNRTGAHQTKIRSAPRTQTRGFYVRVANDGNVENTFILRGTAARPGSTVEYLNEGRDVTRKMRSTTGWFATLKPGQTTQLEIRITPSRTAAAGSSTSAAVSAAWRGDGTRSDLVRASVRVLP